MNVTHQLLPSIFVYQRCRLSRLAVTCFITEKAKNGLPENHYRKAVGVSSKALDYNLLVECHAHIFYAGSCQLAPIIQYPKLPGFRLQRCARLAEKYCNTVSQSCARYSPNRTWLFTTANRRV